MRKAEVVALARSLAPFLIACRGAQGPPGRDGVGIETSDLRCEDERGWVLTLGGGEHVKEYVLPFLHDAGTWRPGKTYPAGAGVTWEGNFWLALVETNDTPGVTPGRGREREWRLAVSRGKRGNDGKDGKDGMHGRDLTQLGSDGTKW